MNPHCNRSERMRAGKIRMEKSTKMNSIKRKRRIAKENDPSSISIYSSIPVRCKCCAEIVHLPHHMELNSFAQICLNCLALNAFKVFPDKLQHFIPKYKPRNKALSTNEQKKRERDENHANLNLTAFHSN